MGRRLPWLHKSEVETVPSTPRRDPKRRRLSKADSDGEPFPTAAVPQQTKTRLIAGHTRTPSTSPPPAPPEEEFMREGPDADDGWIMVEDEFHAIAKTFTQHLHHAEYVRLKEKAKRRSTFPVDVDPPTTDLALDIEQTPRQRKLRQRRVNEQGRTLESLLGNDERSTRTRMDDDLNKDEEDDPWVGTSLHGLMTSPHRPQRPLGDQSRSGSLVKPAKYAASTRSQGAPPRRKDVSGHEATYSTGPDEVQEHSSEASATDGPGDDDLELPATKMNRPGSSRVKSSRSGIDELCRRATVDSRAKPRQAVRLPMKLAAESGKDHSRKDEEKKPTPLQEIPTFLV